MTQTDKKAQPTPGPYFLARHIPWTQCGCEPRVSLNDGTYGMTAIVYCPLHAAAPRMLEALGKALMEHKPCDVLDCWCRNATRVYDDARGV